MATPTYSQDGTTTSYTLLSNVVFNPNSDLLNSVGNINIINAGEYYNYPPQIVITSDDDGYGATAEAHLSMTGGKVSYINVYSSGSGYQNTPTIQIVGGGSNITTPATANAMLSGGQVVSVNINEPGAGYDPSATVVFTNPETNWGYPAIGTVNLSNTGAIRGINIINQGSGYIRPPTVTISGNNTAPASVGYIGISSITLQSINITDHGNGYTTEPTVNIIPNQIANTNVPPLVPAGATAGIGFPLDNIQVINQGQGYTSNANVTVHIRGAGSIGAILIANSGAGYSNTPTVIISSPNDPHGQQAYANALLSQNSISNVIVTNTGTGYTQTPSVSLTAAQNNYPTYSANLVAVLNTGTGASANVTLLPYYVGDPVQGGSYYLRTNPFQTFMSNVSNDFIGNIVIQATLAIDPAETDWFDVKTLTSNNDTIIGKFYWVRARIEDFAAGTVNSLTVSYPYNQ